VQLVELGTSIISFPTIVFLDLQRFHHDPKNGTHTKVTSSFAFPPDIDLGRFTESGESDTYMLFCVVGRHRSVASGDYIAYVRVGRGDRWYEFRDENLTAVGPARAIEDNFGGQGLSRTACALLYDRTSEFSTVFYPISNDRVPAVITRPYWRERRPEQQRHRQGQGQIRAVFVDEDYVRYVTRKNRFSLEPELCDRSRETAFQYTPSYSVRQVYDAIASHLNAPSDTFALYP
jgi:hypothetical protein